MTATLALTVERAGTRPSVVAHILMLASGFAGLGYQIIWTQQGSLWLGHESAAVLAVVAAFFGGMGVGSLALGSRIERSPRPLRWYAACELVIGGWGLFLAFAMAPVSNLLLHVIGVQPSAGWQWAVTFSGTFLLLLPATVAMGATLPAMERWNASRITTHRSIAGLYAANTAGAVTGVLACAFVLIPGLGLLRTTLTCVACNLLCALAASFLAVQAAPLSHAAAARIRSPIARNAWVLLGATGLLGIGYEVLVMRVLSQVTQDTVYTFALLLTVYLFGTAAGAAGYSRWRSRWGDPATLGHRLLCVLAVACLVGTAGLWVSDAVQRALPGAGDATMAGALSGEALLAVLAFGLPTLAMGAAFSHFCARAHEAGLSFGQALGANTLAACTAPVLWGVLAFPLLGAKNALLLLSLGYVALALVAGGGLSRWTWLPIATTLVLALATPPLAFVEVPEGGRILRYEDGVTASVSVVEDSEGIRRLRIDNRQQEGSSHTRRVDSRQALLPLSLHPSPNTVLFLGLGTGITASSAAEDPALHVTAVELLPEVIRASALFEEEGAGASPMRRIASDARRYVRAGSEQYDVVISDNFHPARSGSGSLYTVEHFDAIRARLQPDGFFCQWIPLHQLDLDTLRSIVRSFQQVYPDSRALLASYSLETPVIGLVGRATPGPFAQRSVRAALERPSRPAEWSQRGLEDDMAVMGSFIAGPAALRAFASEAPANTDDRPIVAYRAPRITYAPDSRPRDRLMRLMQLVSIDPAELLPAPADPSEAARLSAYWRARDRFLVTGLQVRPSADVRDMLVQVRAPLLAVLRISPDFRPAYDPLLRMAAALADIDRDSGRELARELATLAPERPEALTLFADLGAPLSSHDGP